MRKYFLVVSCYLLCTLNFISAASDLDNIEMKIKNDPNVVIIGTNIVGSVNRKDGDPVPTDYELTILVVDEKSHLYDDVKQSSKKYDFSINPAIVTTLSNLEPGVWTLASADNDNPPHTQKEVKKVGVLVVSANIKSATASLIGKAPSSKVVVVAEVEIEVSLAAAPFDSEYQLEITSQTFKKFNIKRSKASPSKKFTVQLSEVVTDAKFVDDVAGTRIDLTATATCKGVKTDDFLDFADVKK